MKILYLSSVRIPSEKASGLAIVRQCQAFVDIGNDLDLLIPVRDSSSKMRSIKDVYGLEPKFKVVEFSSFSMYKIGKIGFYAMLFFESLKALWYYYIRKDEFDLVYSRDQRLLAPFVLFGLSEKCYLELHTKYTDLITRLIAKKVKKLIVISKGLEEYYKTFADRSHIQIEPSGVDIEQFSNVSSKKTIRDSFCLPVDKTIFGYIGKYETMGESKGVDEIIEAFSLAFAKNKDIYLLLVGVEDAERSKIFATIDALKLPSSSYSIFVLDQSKFAEYLVACDVLLMNYPNTEHYAKYMSPTKLFAYLATGLPIISSDLPSVRSVAGEEVVLYVEPGDTEKYAKVMLGVFNNLGTVNNQSDQRIRLAYNFEWPARAKRIIDNLWQCN